MTSKKRAKAQSYDPNECVIFGIDVPAAPDHPLVDDDLPRLVSIDEKMVRNIDVFGVLLPIVVVTVQLPAKAPVEYEALMATDWWQALAARGAVWKREVWGTRVPALVAGRSRVIHGRLANKERLARGEEPWFIRSVARRGAEHDPSHRDAAISENRFRRDHSAIAEARKIASRRDAGASWEHCEDVFGMSRSSMENRLALLELAPGVQAALGTRALGQMAALELRDLGLSHEQQERLLASVLAEGVTKRGLVPRIRVLAMDLGLLQTQPAPALPSAEDELEEPFSIDHESLGQVGFAEVGGALPADDELGEWPSDVRDKHGSPLRLELLVDISCGPVGVPARGRIVGLERDADGSPKRWANGYVLQVDTRRGVLSARTQDVSVAILAPDEQGPATDETEDANGFAKALWDAGDDWPNDVRDRHGKPIARGQRVHVEEPGTPPFDGKTILASQDDDGHLLTIYCFEGKRRGQYMASSRHVECSDGRVEPAGVLVERVATINPGSKPSRTLVNNEGPAPGLVKQRIREANEVLSHVPSRKMLTPETLLTLSWLTGQSGPSTRISAALKALQVADPSAAKSKGAGRKASPKTRDIEALYADLDGEMRQALVSCWTRDKVVYRKLEERQLIECDTLDNRTDEQHGAYFAINWTPHGEAVAKYAEALGMRPVPIARPAKRTAAGGSAARSKTRTRAAKTAPKKRSARGARTKAKAS